MARIELATKPWQGLVLPLAPHPQNDWQLILLYSVNQGESWCPRSDSNRHGSLHWLLRPAWLPLHHRGKNYRIRFFSICLKNLVAERILKLVAESRSRTWCLELMRLPSKPFLSSAQYFYLTLSKYSLPIFPASISALAINGGLALILTKGRAPLCSSLTLTAVINTLSKWLTTGVTCLVIVSLSGPASRNRTWINSLEGYCTVHCANAS